MRGSAIERSQNRQRKLDGIVTWYFDYVMESLPLMLQFALLLLGCALSRYLWGVDTTVASVVLGVTSFGVASYAFFVIAGVASTSCPYQTPIAHLFHLIPPITLSTLHSAFSRSNLVYGVTHWWNVERKNSKFSIGGVVLFILLSPLGLLINLIFDARLLARAMVRGFVVNALRVRGWFHGARGRDPQTTALDLQCISWMLQASLDKAIHLLTLKVLATMTTLADFDPALVSACFDIFTACVSITGDGVAILQGSEELATVSALCCLRTLSHLTTVDPTSSVFKDMRQRYTKRFPIWTNFEGLPFYHRFCTIHHTFYPSRTLAQLENRYPLPISHRPSIEWKDYKPSSAEHTVLVQLARFKYQRKQRQKVPRWILRFVYHRLFQDPILPVQPSLTAYRSSRWTWAALSRTLQP